MARRNGFERRFILRPDNGGVSDLLRLLLTRDVSKNNLLECDEEEQGGLKQRLLISFSIIIQIIFLYIKGPVALIGRTIEDWVNLIANRGFVAVVSDLLHGEKLVFPDTKTTSYRSIVGHADARVDLDEKIRAGDGRYLPALTMMAAKLAYENPATIKDVVENHWNMELFEVFDCSNYYYGNLLSTQAVMFSDKHVNPDLIIVSFRGTQPFDMIQWCADVDFSWYEHSEAGRIHEGFMRALGMQNDREWPKEIGDSSSRFAYYAVRGRLRQLLSENPNAKLVLTGHSLGGALAVLFPVVLKLHDEKGILDRLEGVYTFGQPRVGNEKLGKFLTPLLDKKYFRVVYGNDIVPRLPFEEPVFQYKHFGKCLYYDSSYHGQVVTEEPNRNYFSLVHLVPKYLNAGYELCRGFVIGRRRGRDYREGWILTLLRCFGLVVPGLPAHLPQDYVNSTRLTESLLESDLSGIVE